MKFKSAILGASLLATAALTGCGGGGGSTYGLYSSPTITVNGFVNALNSVDGQNSDVVLYTDETIRSTYAGQEDWFVIYDDKYNEYKAVSLQYIRALTYYDYYSNNYATAEEFRDRESDDIFNGYLDGDLYGDDYEVVDMYTNGYVDGVFYSTYFVGRESGYAYEDETESTDVNLLAGEAQAKKLAAKVANLSYAYKMAPETALSLISLGEKAEKMLKKGSSEGELTTEDQAVLLNDVQHLTGVTLEEVIANGETESGRKEMLKKIAEKTGTNAQTLEDKVLPELFGIQK